MRDLRDLFLEWSLRATDAWALLGTDFVFNPAIGYHDPSCKTNKLFSLDKNYPPVQNTLDKTTNKPFSFKLTF